MKEVEFKRFHEAKRRLRTFLIQTDMSDVEERQRLLSFFCHRFVTLVSILKEATRSKRLMKSASDINDDGVNT